MTDLELCLELNNVTNAINKANKVISNTENFFGINNSVLVDSDQVFQHLIFITNRTVTFSPIEGNIHASFPYNGVRICHVYLGKEKKRGCL